MDNMDKCQKVTEDVHKDEKKLKRAEELMAMMQASQELKDYRNDNHHDNDKPHDNDTPRNPPMIRIQSPPRDISTGIHNCPIPINELIRLVREVNRDFQESRRVRTNDFTNLTSLKRLQRISRIRFDLIDVETPVQAKAEGVMAKMARKVFAPVLGETVSSVIEPAEEYTDEPYQARTPEESKLEKSLLELKTKPSTGTNSESIMKKRRSRKWHFKMDDGRRINPRAIREKRIEIPPDVAILLKIREIPFRILIASLKKEKIIRDRRKAEANSRQKSKSNSQNSQKVKLPNSPLPSGTDDTILVDPMRSVEKLDQSVVDKTSPRPLWNSCKVHPPKPYTEANEVSAGIWMDRKLTSLSPRTRPVRISNPDGYPKSSGASTPQSGRIIREKTRHRKKSTPNTSRSRKTRNPDYERRLNVSEETKIPIYDRRLDLPGRPTSPLPPYTPRAHTNTTYSNGCENKYGEIIPQTRRSIPPVIDPSNEEQIIPGCIPPENSGQTKSCPQFRNQMSLDEGIQPRRMNIFCLRDNEVPWERLSKNYNPVQYVEDGIDIVEELIAPDTLAIKNSVVKKVRKYLATNKPQDVAPQKGLFRRIFSKKKSEETVNPPEPHPPPEQPNEPTEKKNGCFSRIWRRITTSSNRRATPTTENI